MNRTFDETRSVIRRNWDRRNQRFDCRLPLSISSAHISVLDIIIHDRKPVNEIEQSLNNSLRPDDDKDALKLLMPLRTDSRYSIFLFVEGGSNRFQRDAALLYIREFLGEKKQGRNEQEGGCDSGRL